MAINQEDRHDSGLILINKPRGMTSFGVVSRLRRLTGIRRIGHTGTLDPFADGLLPVCIGRATAAVQFMDGYDKTYQLGIEFGRATDTQDLTGQTVFEHDLTDAEKKHLSDTCFIDLYRSVEQLIGQRQQTPPMYSAVKIDGRPLYEYARRGQTIERKSRLIRIDRALVTSVSLDGVFKASIVIGCSKGTYIRTIADDLGRELGFGAHAASLTRLQCGPFKLEQAQDLEQLFAWRENFPDQPSFRRYLAEQKILLPIDLAFSDFPNIDLPKTEAVRLIQGQPVWLSAEELTGQLPDFNLDGPVVVNSEERLIAVCRLLEEFPLGIRLKTERVLIDLADFQQA